MLFLCCLYSVSSWAVWHDGDSILVEYDKSEMITTNDEEIASINIGFKISKKGEIKGNIHIIKDSMIIDYYDKRNLIKKESYILNKKGEPILTGNQYYYVDNRLLSVDVLRNGRLVCSIWYDAKGNIDKNFVYTQDMIAWQTQFYTTG